MRATRELGAETENQGQAFLAAVARPWPAAGLDWAQEKATEQQRPMVYPVAVGAVAAAQDIPLEPALAAYLHALAANLVSAGIRLIPLGQSDGQQALADLESVILDAVAQALERNREDIGQAALMVDWASARHETPIYPLVPLMSTPFRVGIGGPVGTGKTALMDALCKRLRDDYDIAAITKRYLHRGRRPVPDAFGRAGAGAHPRSRDRRVPAHGHPRGRFHESRGGRRHGGALPGPGHRAGSSPAVIILLPPSPRNSPISPSTSSTFPLATRSHARVGPASRAPTCWSSTRPTSRRWSAPASK